MTAQRAAPAAAQQVTPLSRLQRTTRQLLRPVRWWAALTPPERVLYRAVALLAIGFALIWLPLGFIAPGLIFAVVFFLSAIRRTT
jgi:hypothetical protein